ncbi:Gfo/Idh/MocA family oxidoreductase [bacterium]|nr:Gfo/Idh/MocA family oxidoreductase [bacterium]
MKKKYNIGIIGMGMIGDVHLECIRKDGRGEVTWIAARSEETLNKKLNKYRVPHGTTDYHDMLKDPSVSAVIIASPPFTHLEITKSALKAGKHILLEKPMVVSPDELDTLLKLIKRYPDLLVLECSCRHARLQPKFKYVRKIIRDGVLGEIYHIHHQHLTRSTFIEYNPAGIWAHQKALAGGGPLIDWGVYDLSFHLGILDDVPNPVTVESFTRNDLKEYDLCDFKSDIEEHGAAFMTFDTGLTYYYERGAGVHFEAPNQTRIHGSRGGLQFSFCTWDAPEVTLFYLDASGNEAKTVIIPEGLADHDDNLALTSHFLDFLEGRVKPQMTVSLAAKYLRILFRIIKN